MYWLIACKDDSSFVVYVHARGRHISPFVNLRGRVHCIHVVSALLRGIFSKRLSYRKYWRVHLESSHLRKRIVQGLWDKHCICKNTMHLFSRISMHMPCSYMNCLWCHSGDRYLSQRERHDAKRWWSTPRQLRRESKGICGRFLRSRELVSLLWQMRTRSCKIRVSQPVRGRPHDEHHQIGLREPVGRSQNQVADWVIARVAWAAELGGHKVVSVAELYGLQHWVGVRFGWVTELGGS